MLSGLLLCWSFSLLFKCFIALISKKWITDYNIYYNIILWLQELSTFYPCAGWVSLRCTQKEKLCYCWYYNTYKLVLRYSSPVVLRSPFHLLCLVMELKSILLKFRLGFERHGSDLWFYGDFFVLGVFLSTTFPFPKTFPFFMLPK